MSDDVTTKRKDRMDKLELLQELYFILHRNSLDPVDYLCKFAIDRKFTGKLELLIEHTDTRPLRRDFTVSMRLIRDDQAERPGAISYPIDPQALLDMYERLKPEETKVLDGPEENVTYFDVSKGEELK